MTELEQNKQALADRTAELEQVKRVANELAAQVEQLRKAFNNAVTWEDVRDVLKQTPTQCLAEVRAQAVEDLKEPLYKSGKADADIGDWLKEVAKIIRKQAKP